MHKSHDDCMLINVKLFTATENLGIVYAWVETVVKIVNFD